MIKKLNHLGIIMDGNRRFAKRLLKNPWNGHSMGARKVEEVLDWCYEQKIPTVTLYALSLENLNTRPKKELDFLMNIFKKEFTSENFHNKLHKNKTCVRFFGKLKLLPKELQEIIQDIVEITKNYNNTYLNFAIAYSGRQEIIEAIKKLDEKNISNLDEKTFEKYLYT
ncbi:MAG: di-trans,poly-cis-decaprenylcistransferase, partial [Candidatus Aenigmarchaeota archaeon]|nr:di-trans,poly-cis-decaprenylcistransferase [Candidatus Aenigmarchaeota archaeon]